MEIFTNQQAAHEYVDAIQEPRQRLLTEAAMSKAVHAWLSDPTQASKLMSAPIDLLAFAKGVHAFFGDLRILAGILDGSLTRLEDLTEVF